MVSDAGRVRDHAADVYREGPGLRGFYRGAAVPHGAWGGSSAP